MAAMNVNLDYSTVIGTPTQVHAFMNLLRPDATVNVSMVGANIVLLDVPLTREQLQTAIATTPNQQTLV